MTDTIPDQTEKDKRKSSFSEIIIILFVAGAMLWAVISWVKDMFRPGTTSNCRPSEITKETEIKDEDGNVIRTDRETIPGMDCGGVFIPRPEDQ